MNPIGIMVAFLRVARARRVMAKAAAIGKARRETREAHTRATVMDGWRRFRRSDPARN